MRAEQNVKWLTVILMTGLKQHFPCTSYIGKWLHSKILVSPSVDHSLSHSNSTKNAAA